jgi:hypothetical protein
MTFLIVITAAIVVNVGGIALIKYLMSLPWRYRGVDMRGRIHNELDRRWLHCMGGGLCSDCHRLNECLEEIIPEVKAEIDAKKGIAK